MTNKNTLAQHFTEMLEQDRTVAIPTGFKQLDSILNGGIRPGLYVIGGVSSIGKTSFVLQMADNIVATEHGVLYFNLEQSSSELFAKSLSRETYKMKKEKGLSASEILYEWKSLTDSQKKTVQEAQDRLYDMLGETIYYYDTPMAVKGTQQGIKEIRQVKNSRGYEEAYVIYENQSASQVIKDIEAFKKSKASEDIEDVEDPEDVKEIDIFEDIHNQLLGYIGQVDEPPVVIIDYLQILQPSIGMERSTDKQIADYNILSLKKLSNRYKIPIIAISSFSRTSYDKPVSMEAFKETGAIEYSADVLIGLQYQGKMVEEKNPATNRTTTKWKREEPNTKNGVEIRKVEAVVLKNRMGALGTPLKFDYLPAYNYFQEVKK